MLSTLIRKKWALPAIGAGIVIAVVAFGLTSANTTKKTLVIYNGRAHYGTEKVFRDFEKDTGIKIEIRGGDGPTLFEQLSSEGPDTPADVLVTTDLANLWRAREAGLIEPTTSAKLKANIPADLHEPNGYWWPITTRMRIPMISTERVDPTQVTGYESLGDPQFKGRTCLRTSSNEYNQSLVADMLTKRGHDKTKALLESWMTNQPKIITNDGELLQEIADGDCDLGLTNHYYLARILIDDPEFPVSPAWPNQDGPGAHTNISGVAAVKGTDQPEETRKLIEYLTSAKAEKLLVIGGEFSANPTVKPEPHIQEWAKAKQDPISPEAGSNLEAAAKLMLEVGWR